MKHIAIAMMLSGLFISCGSSKSDLANQLFSVEYTSQSHLMGSETRIEVRGNAMKLLHSEKRSGKTVQGAIVLDESELESLHQLLREIHFHEITLPTPGKLLDAPIETIAASFDNQQSSYSIGLISEKPKEILQLRRLLFSLASKHSEGMKKALGY